MRRSSVGFILLNVLVSIAVALAILYLLPVGSGITHVPVTVQYIVTATPDSDGIATQIAVAVEATIDVALTNQLTNVATVNIPRNLATIISNAPTTNPDSAAAQGASAGASLPNGCIFHEIAEGDTPFGLAEEYGISGASIMIVNQLDEDRAVLLQIGDRIIIPLPECPIEQLLPTPTATFTPGDTATPSLTPENTQDPDIPTSTPTPTFTPTPTLTATPVLAPTAFNAQVRIERLISPGDITAEGVEIRNTGNVVDLTGWTLTDSEDNEFVFPEQRLFTNGLVTMYTRIGENTPISLFWGRSIPVWDDADVVTLSNATGQVQSSVRVAPSQ